MSTFLGNEFNNRFHVFQSQASLGCFVGNLQAIAQPKNIVHREVVVFRYFHNREICKPHNRSLR